MKYLLSEANGDKIEVKKLSLSKLNLSWKYTQLLWKDLKYLTFNVWIFASYWFIKNFKLRKYAVFPFVDYLQGSSLQRTAS